ncbi:MAG: nucleoside-diphosphate sugar epimerase/dehydratase [Bacillota bacterium]
MSKRIAATLTIDTALLTVAVFLSLYLRWNIVPISFSKDVTVFGILAVIILLLCSYLCGSYHRIWQYAGIHDFLVIILAVTIGIAIIFVAALILKLRFTAAVPAALWLMSLLFLLGTRFIQRLLWGGLFKESRPEKSKRTLIVGAGEAGALIAKTLRSTRTGVGLTPVGFVDDDPEKKALQLCGLKILGTRFDIPDIVRKRQVEEAIIAIPSATIDQIKTIDNICRQAGVGVKVLPSVLHIVQGKQLLEQVHELQMEDLLHRNEVDINLEQVSAYLKDQVIMVTGAGGSIGAELCRQICAFQPRRLLLLGRGENSIYEISLDLSRKWPRVEHVPLIADVRDREKLFAVFARYRPAVVFHAAAHKHVPLMELQPEEAFKNNVFGTLNTAEAAYRHKTERFILISTDKAVNPSSVMGLTKLLAEMIIRYYARFSKKTFAAVRFGNVLGSRGSVVQLFRRQIAMGGPVTVTHPEMRRFFMTVREAVRLVIQAGALAKGGEVFILDMGDPVKILDLAHDMIRLKGLCPGKDIEIKFTCMRPGEKLCEQLLSEKEKTVPSNHRKIHVVANGAFDQALVNLIFTYQEPLTAEKTAVLVDLARAKFNLPKNDVCLGLNE